MTDSSKVIIISSAHIVCYFDEGVHKERVFLQPDEAVKFASEMHSNPDETIHTGFAVSYWFLGGHTLIGFDSLDNARRYSQSVRLCTGAYIKETL